MDRLEDKIITLLNRFKQEAKLDENFILSLEKLMLIEKILSAKNSRELDMARRVLVIINKIHYQKYTLHSKLNQLSRLFDYWK